MKKADDGNKYFGQQDKQQQFGEGDDGFQKFDDTGNNPYGDLGRVWMGEGSSEIRLEKWKC
jgi:hypothetical protein